LDDGDKQAKEAGEDDDATTTSRSTEGKSHKGNYN
jgi:hypothetical protein